jgi:P27 family predicted phage terminase small subunit
MPECPAYLTGLAQKEWDRLLAELSTLRVLTNLDLAALAGYCSSYGMWVDATEAIQKFGTVVKSPKGYPIQSPYVSIANRQAELMIRYASEFGFTPASRSGIKAQPIEHPGLFDS